MQKGDIRYKIVTFSDSQKLVNLLDKYAEGATNVEESVTIISRMSWEDVQVIIAAHAALKEAGFKYIHLYVPYFLGARSDRKFQSGSVNYLREVICPLINSLNFESVTVLDPHSNCLEMGLQRFKKKSSVRLVNSAISAVYNDDYVNSKHHSQMSWGEYEREFVKNKFTLVGPDRGSYERVTEAAKAQETRNVLMCDKHRDILTGKILSIDTGGLTSFNGDDVFIIDDICDGAGTFTMLAEKLKNFEAKRMFLVVTHGIFSKGYLELSKYFNGIFTTNSVIAAVPTEAYEGAMIIKQFDVLNHAELERK